MIIEPISTQRLLDYGYEIRTEYWSEPGDSEKTKMICAYTLDGYYMGKPETAYFICIKRGIRPSYVPFRNSALSIGFNHKEQKWYGWSHRAISGFGIGDVVKEGDCAASPGMVDEYIEEHPEEDLSLPTGFVAKTLDDAKRIAIAFAESVS